MLSASRLKKRGISAMKTKDKEQAYYDYVEMARHAWTFCRMTEQEQDRCLSALRFAKERCLLSGTYALRWGQLQTIYNAFLLGLGYTGGLWREKETDDLPSCVGVSA
jgi:hypothetical protein